MKVIRKTKKNISVGAYIPYKLSPTKDHTEKEGGRKDRTGKTGWNIHDDGRDYR